MGMPLPPSGQAMDSPVPARPRRWPWWAGAGLLVVLAATWWGRDAVGRFGNEAQSLSSERVSIHGVSRGVFDDAIQLRGPALPLDTVYLDAIEGGRVEQRLVEDGARVRAGQALAVLSNNALQLDLIRSETEVTSQLNTLRSLELQIERDRADNRRALAEAQWQLQRARLKAERDQQLQAQGFISQAAAQDSAHERDYLAQRLDILQSTQRSDAALQTSQAEQLRHTSRQMQANLQLARRNLEALTVRAPVAGQLTAFDITPGQSLARGQRLGQIDSDTQSKLVAAIDEHFLPRVAVGQLAMLELGAQRYPMRVRKLNPQVKGGQFEAELVFNQAQPEGLKRGQSLQVRLQLAEPKPALLLPAGPFLADSAGGFVFVLEAPGRASKRTVQLGRRNGSSVEVLAGLREGDQVITSSYAGFADKTQLFIR
jgi:HlyD family secretion protein